MTTLQLLLLSLRSTQSTKIKYIRILNWTHFRDIVSNSLSLNVSLKSAIDIENAINVFTTTIQNAAFTSTPKSSLKTMTEAHKTEVVNTIK